MRLVLAGVLILVAGLLSACFGDPGIQVYYRNETGNVITVYPLGRQYPDQRISLAAGDERKDALLVSSTESNALIARIEAVDATGALIYCHRFQYGKLKQLRGVISIRLGDNNC